MAVGMQCFDADGKEIFSNDSVTTYTIGTFSVNERVNGYIQNDFLKGKNIWYSITKLHRVPNMQGSYSMYLGLSMPYFSFDKNQGKLSWTWRDPLDQGHMACLTSGESGFDCIYGVW